MQKIYSWNVNGIRAAQRKGFLNWLEQTSPDILCIQETKAWPEQLDKSLLEPNGYHTYWAQAEKKGYSGTAIYTKQKPLNIEVGLPDRLVGSMLSDKYGDTSKEGRVLALEFNDFYLSTVYTPNSKDDLSRIPMRQSWDPIYLAYMQQMEESKPVIFCGDLNVAHTEIDLARPKQNEGKKGFTREERAGLEAYFDAGYTDTFRMFNQEGDNYTYWSNWGKSRERNVGWRIDYFMASKDIKSRVKNAYIHPDIMGSDHCPVSIELEG